MSISTFVHRLLAVPPRPRRHGGIGRCNECGAPQCKAKDDVMDRYAEFVKGKTREA
jgi:hypothetical protein